MKKQVGDLLAVVFVIAFACMVIFFPWTISMTGKVVCGKLSEGFDNFGKFTNAYPYLMGFFKVGLLATFGEMLKIRRKTGSWKVTSLPLRFLVWGITGLVFTLVFALFAKGTAALMATNLWFGEAMPTVGKPSFGQTLLFAFSTSFFMNMIFAYPMMLAHEWCNSVINAKHFVGGTQFLTELDKHIWGSFIPGTLIWFWIPAHTVTFCLPADYRVLMSAVLSLALGFLLTFRKPGK